MTDTTDDIAFLANSENRVAILGALLEGPHSRHVLAETTGVSRVTLGRILDDLAERRWIDQRGQIAEITTLGRWVHGAFEDLVATMAAERRLRRVYDWFPPDGYGFDVRRLADAEITTVSRADASAPISRLIRQFDVGGTVRAFSFAITGQFLEACWRRVVDGTVTWEWVFTPAVLDVLRGNEAMAAWSREMLEVGGATYHLHPGPIPYVVIISTAAVNLRLADEDGAATALIQTDDPEVREWAERTHESYLEAATELDAEAFAG